MAKDANGNEVPQEDANVDRIRVGVVPPGSITDWDSLLKQVGLTDNYKNSDQEYDFDRLAQDMAQLNKPQAPDKYDFSLPPGLKLPKGIGDWRPDPEFTSSIALIARANGISQDTMNQFIGEYAKNQINKFNTAQDARGKAAEARNAEMAKLGPNGADRINSVKSALSAQYGNDHGIDAVNSKGIQVLEDLISKANAGGRAATQRGSGEAKAKASDSVVPGAGVALLRAANAKAA